MNPAVQTHRKIPPPVARHPKKTAKQSGRQHQEICTDIPSGWRLGRPVMLNEMRSLAYSLCHQPNFIRFVAGSEHPDEQALMNILDPRDKQDRDKLARALKYEDPVCDQIMTVLVRQISDQPRFVEIERE